MKLCYRNLYASFTPEWVLATDAESEEDRRLYAGCGYLGRELVALGPGRPVVVGFEPVWTKHWQTEARARMDTQLQALLARRFDKV